LQKPIDQFGLSHVHFGHITPKANVLVQVGEQREVKGLGRGVTVVFAQEKHIVCEKKAESNRAYRLEVPGRKDR